MIVFRNQVEGEGGIADSLRGEVKYFYQILYSKSGEYGVYVYDEEGVGSGKVGVKYLACENNKVAESPITLPSSAETVAVFPVVAIEVEESKKIGEWSECCEVGEEEDLAWEAVEA